MRSSGNLVLVAVALAAAVLLPAARSWWADDGSKLSIPASSREARELAAALFEEERFIDAERVGLELLKRRDSEPADHLRVALANFGRWAYGAFLAEDEGARDRAVTTARRECEEALKGDASLAAASYVRGVIARSYALELGPKDALADLRRAVELVPGDVGARFHLAMALEEVDARDDAVPLFTEIEALGKEFAGGYYRTTVYRLSRILLRGKDDAARQRGKVLLELYKTLPEPPSNEAETRAQLLGDLGRLRAPKGVSTTTARMEAAIRPAIVSWAPPKLALPFNSPRAFALADLDGDFHEDLVAVGASGLLLSHQCRARTFVVRQHFDGDLLGVVASELEHCGCASVLAWSESALRLFTPDANGVFTEESALLPEGGALAGLTAITPVDFDHDGNLDLLLAAGGHFRLWRSRGVPRKDDINDVPGEKLGPIGFDDVSEKSLPAGLEGQFALTEDFDNDHDVDLLFGGTGKPTRLLSNLRRGRFEVIESGRSGLPDALAGAPELQDFDHDGVVDVLLRGTAPRLLRGRGDLTFAATAVPPRFERASAGEATLADADLDGELEWLDAPLVVPAATPLTAPLATDVDLDSALDQVGLMEQGVAIAFGSLTRAPRRTLLVLRGRKDNHFATGALVEVRAGGRYQRRYVRRATQLFGLFGDDPPIIRITWTDGVLQHPLQDWKYENFAPLAADDAEMIAAIYTRMPNGLLETHFDLSKDVRCVVRQKKGPPGSCPFLYAWNGTTYEFITDALGATPLGLPIDEEHFVEPDHDELLRVTARQLQPIDGELRFQLTEELRETTYLDRAELWVVDAAADVEIHPEERFCFPPFPPTRIHAMRRIEPLVQVIDQAGRDWTAALAAPDDVPAIPFTPLSETYRGIATPHELTLTLPEGARTAARVRLLMTGWLQWGDASVNLAAAKSGSVEFIPPILSVPDGAGGWQAVGPPVGFPAGKTKTMVLDVGQWLRRDDPRIKLMSTIELYWDVIRVALDGQVPMGAEAADPAEDAVGVGGDAPFTVTKLEPAKAELWARGFSKPLPRRREQAERYDWNQLEPIARFDQHVGMLTRYGDVLPLLGEVDDRFVLLSSGDAVDLRFDARALPPLAAGMERTYLLFLDGWAKDADLNTTFGQTVEPLPFHAMSGYPYGAAEHFPDDAIHASWQREWNTRPGVRLLPNLASR